MTIRHDLGSEAEHTRREAERVCKELVEHFRSWFLDEFLDGALLHESLSIAAYSDRIHDDMRRHERVLRQRAQDFISSVTAAIDTEMRLSFDEELSRQAAVMIQCSLNTCLGADDDTP
jgi:hypothetical protein